MMRQYELVERVQRYKPDVNEALLNKAYVYAMQKHGHQKRASGDPYFSHPLEVAAILTEMHMDEATIAVALLHDTIEDTTATRAEIDELFGPEMGKLVEGLTKLKKLDLVSKKAEQAENLRKLLLAISEDVRVLLVKLADRLHNMRTLDHVPEAKRLRIAEETMDIYAPLAGRMGMQGMREELEEIAFRFINPEAYRAVTARLAEIFERNKDVLSEIEKALSTLFDKYAIKAEVKSRQKKPWSVFRKMEAKALSFEQLSDIFGFRVVVDTVEDCYRALGAIHTTWSMVPGRFKDYISTPKQNDYRSIHTTIVGPSRQRVELQIRTYQMNKIAEYGVAAHSIYKDSGGKVNGTAHAISKETNAYAWLRRTIEQLAEGDNPEDFLENTKLELFQDQVFCFTPKGMLIALPRGATPIDFAYAVHTDVGDTCVGAKVNGRIMPLMTELKNGDEVEIIRSKAQVPPAAWESVVVTGKARSAIRRATKNAIRKQYSGLGIRILERAFERSGKIFTKESLKSVLHRLARKDIEDVLASVGRGELASTDVIKAVFPDYKDERITLAAPKQREEGWSKIRNAAGMLFQIPGRAARKDKDQPRDGAVPIRGVRGDLPVRFAPEGAVPGDRIVGIVQPGTGITIYPIQSPALQAFDDQPERWIDVRWDIDERTKERFPARVSVTAINAPGSLADIAQVVASNDANIHTLSMVRTAPDFTEMLIDLEVWDLKHLNRLLSQLKDNSSVSDARRVNG
ncbi:MAG: bifunctional (p)ppGpp synthetase/guanosine-3',5'-bis(diphosphate) 3'-pyrophosphohydrolase [Mesorhizobium sp.]|jgi:GTP diphosphokinase / guanosine-3',5'-bis(diphosphate) 3'-diphosphatase|uniref:GTP pyrophosphokinase rsh n=1 Tax=Mesorhizobium muleiense TaxID=1004279 RepID=A0A1G8J2B9_9HYPH|nr:MULTISPECIES: bifunctional (p)ppGpp synthetase/guanosine-3',5'-bis(diphosphate) 3'-pyrophosphohydrolase [Mesorhizobium]ESZ17964.1 GTP pyrophosphokinase [Mesorhizobium sp. L48C026A00]MCF6099858.1 bifunctional (p)ppGpp synthetase/guanosine-3',5'-bis(diphosphate) 3'-pyrophosphohydrolase [Mesorhizobium muleiense]MCF6118502.1 bifunctional (p)ppGpp synthetase/guanosine-3',5'-bis(diphosphate) 3'-pyrophosphohydrolase [Mesorhizobium muleiense]RWB93623.1 MAG: bifunctional (p)ppGpp synthetase/guanosine